MIAEIAAVLLLPDNSSIVGRLSEAEAKLPLLNEAEAKLLLLNEAEALCKPMGHICLCVSPDSGQDLPVFCCVSLC